MVGISPLGFRPIHFGSVSGSCERSTRGLRAPLYRMTRTLPRREALFRCSHLLPQSLSPDVRSYTTLHACGHQPQSCSDSLLPSRRRMEFSEATTRTVGRSSLGTSGLFLTGAIKTSSHLRHFYACAGSGPSAAWMRLFATALPWNWRCRKAPSAAS